MLAPVYQNSKGKSWDTLNDAIEAYHGSRDSCKNCRLFCAGPNVPYALWCLKYAYYANVITKEYIMEMLGLKLTSKEVDTNDSRFSVDVRKDSGPRSGS